MRRLLVRHPFVSYSLIGMVLGLVCQAFHFQYDDPDIGKLVFWLAFLFSGIFWAVHEALWSTELPPATQFALALSLGLAISAGLDWLWRTCVLRKL